MRESNEGGGDCGFTSTGCGFLAEAISPQPIVQSTWCEHAEDRNTSRMQRSKLLCGNGGCVVGVEAGEVDAGFGGDVFAKTAQ